jgi:hypothetical protein
MKGGEANIKMGPQEIGCDGADWIQLSGGRFLHGIGVLEKEVFAVDCSPSSGLPQIS